VVRFNALQQHWAETAPPTYVSMAAWIGYRPKKRPADEQDVDFEGFMRALAPDGRG
jgi:hypothetical protein